MIKAEQVLAAIGTGASAARSSKELRRIAGIGSDRELRRTIETLRRSGHVIISGDRGYYLPETAAEVKRHIKKESRRARSIFFTLKSARELEKKMEKGVR